MAIENFNEDVEVIQKLDTLPNQEGGLSAEELKAKFDQAAMAIKNFINNSLLPVVRELEEAKDPSIIYGLDQTLRELGRAADAKAVGDALAGKVGTKDIIDITHGGTGAANAEDARRNLDAAQTAHTHSVGDMNTGLLPLERGGTGAGTAAQAMENLGITAALAGKAPAGYGLGGEAEQKDWSEVDSITANGTYRFDGIHQTINGIYVTSATMLVINFGGSYCTQILRTVENASGHYKSYTLVRSKGAIGWGAWECPDPPMQVGVEYRTTKRWMGNVVYAKLVEVGSLLNKGTKRVTHNSGGSYYTYALGIAIAGTTTLLFTYEGTRGKAYVEGSDVVFECAGDLSAYYGYILIEYVK